jgi:hypothetical protein
MQGTIPAGGEVFSCQFFATPNTASAFIVGGSHTYTPGSHHVELFRTDLGSVPAGQDAPQDCYEGPNGSLMGHIRGVLYGAQTPTGQIQYPGGVGLPLQPGEVVLMQTHYLNAGAADLQARADVTVQISDGTGISQHAGVLFFYDPFIDVPPSAPNARAQMRCLVPSDITIFSAASHYHARGYDYEAYLDPAQGALAQTPFYTSNDWNHPTPLSTPLTVPGGSHIRFNCGYKNPDATKEYFQGQSAANNEMCMFVAVYYPELGQQADFCGAGPDMLGTGTATCYPTLQCYDTCTKNGAAPLPTHFGPDTLGGADGGAPLSIDPCYQKCFVASCGNAVQKMAALGACSQSHCATECATANSGACATCAQTSCGNELGACLNDTCN